jgi:L-cystine transport system permease protein
VNRPFDPRFILDVFPDLLLFLPVTLAVVAATVLAGTVLAVALAAAKLGRFRALRALADGYTWILRCTPSIVLLFIVYYGLPEFLLRAFGVNINGWHRAFFVVVTFTLFYSATMSEILRAAYLSVDRGQREAAVSAGLSELQAFRRIVAPQALVVALPNIANSITALMKEGALAYTIGLIDVMGQGTLIVARNYGAYALEVYIGLALIYWGLTVAVERIFAILEARLSLGRRDVAQA